MKLFRHLVLPVAMAMSVAACDGDGTVVGTSEGANTAGATAADATGNIVQTAVDAGSFNTLAAALGATGLDAVLADETRQFTVFAPTDEAFAALGQDTINSLLADPDALSDILLYHVLADQNVDSTTAISLAGNSVPAANGDNLQISLQDGNLFINTSQVTAADVGATNGTIHVIDSVLLPPADTGSDEGEQNDDSQDSPQVSNIVETALAAGSFNTLAAALEATGLVPVLADEKATFTVFAPTDEAFAALGQETIDGLLADPDTLRDILLYHVIAGQAVNAETAIGLAGSSVEMANGDEIGLSLDAGRLFVNQSQVTATDVIASNGIIHVIDAVLLPPADEPPATQLDSIYNTAIAAGNFHTLVAALQATGLDGPLAGGHEIYTVFAPTDAAFAALGQETIDSLLADPETLKNILLYHVIADTAVDAATALSLAGNSVEMANGDSVQLSVREGHLFINDSAVTVTDIQATNGIIHVIDSVLLPH
ncbi:MAG: fasciclin domain-containing protein [Pseudomonadota bacterium]